jgi:hypothetical protein
MPALKSRATTIVRPSAAERPRARDAAAAGPRSARRRGVRLAESVDAVLRACPAADRDNVRHTLILLALPPLTRLRRSLLRGRAATLHR